MKLSKMMFSPSKFGQNKQLLSFQHSLLPSKRLLLFPISKRMKLFPKMFILKCRSNGSSLLDLFPT